MSTTIRSLTEFVNRSTRDLHNFASLQPPPNLADKVIVPVNNPSVYLGLVSGSCCVEIETMSSRVQNNLCRLWENIPLWGELDYKADELIDIRYATWVILHVPKDLRKRSKEGSSSAVEHRGWR